MTTMARVAAQKLKRARVSCRRQSPTALPTAAGDAAMYIELLIFPTTSTSGCGSHVAMRTSFDYIQKLR